MTTPAQLYGTDILAIDDLPDPEVLGAGEINVAYALARRLAQPPDAMEEVGDTDEWDSIDVRDFLGGDFDLTDPTFVDQIQQQATQVLRKDPRVLTVTVQATLASGKLTLVVIGQGAAGPFSFVVAVDQVTVTLSELQP